VARVVGQQIAREQVHFAAALLAVEHLDPQEVLHWHIAVAVYGAVGAIGRANILLQIGNERLSRLAVVR
jgi:hypothetical protein